MMPNGWSQFLTYFFEENISSQTKGTFQNYVITDLPWAPHGGADVIILVIINKPTIEDFAKRKFASELFPLFRKGSCFLMFERRLPWSINLFPPGISQRFLRQISFSYAFTRSRMTFLERCIFRRKAWKLTCTTSLLNTAVSDEFTFLFCSKFFLREIRSS